MELGFGPELRHAGVFSLSHSARPFPWLETGWRRRFELGRNKSGTNPVRVPKARKEAEPSQHAPGGTPITSTGPVGHTQGQVTWLPLCGPPGTKGTRQCKVKQVPHFIPSSCFPLCFSYTSIWWCSGAIRTPMGLKVPHKINWSYLGICSE